MRLTSANRGATHIDRRSWPPLVLAPVERIRSDSAGALPTRRAASRFALWLGGSPKATVKLADLGITTVGELAAATPEVLQEHFGLTYATWLLRAAQGIDDSPVRTSSEPKSISRETTFERDLHVRRDRAELSAVFTALCQQVGTDLRRKGYTARTIGIKLRFADFTTVTRDLTLPLPTTDGAAIRRAAGECLRRVDLNQRLRLLGVRASHLVPLAADKATAGQRELPL